MGIVVDLLVFVLCGAALCCHAIMLASCALLSLDGETSNGSYGLFFLNLPDSGTDTCTEMRFVDEVSGRYGDDGIIWQPRQDTYLRAAQIGSSFAFGCGFVLVMFIFCRQFCCPLPCTEFLMDVCCLAIQVGLGMVYLLWISDGCHYFECDIGEGSYLLIVAQALWFLAACFTKCMRPSAFQRRKMAEEEAKKVEEEEKKAEEEEAKKKDPEDA
ncbi:unnamed protein product [Cylindrotheca closterium]|uniref:Uncharacterized protein n=1 Tax=Cylindrotheca closterium TaxID=2856 RepID=A0AAD2GCY2_9STRA|nr:unnamed protein product [Cylindrotheca closterium]